MYMHSQCNVLSDIGDKGRKLCALQCVPPPEMCKARRCASFGAIQRNKELVQARDADTRMSCGQARDMQAGRSSLCPHPFLVPKPQADAAIVLAVCFAAGRLLEKRQP